VWADDDYRAQNLHWQQTFQRDLDDFNVAAAALFGIRFQPAYYDWDRRAAPGAKLEDGLGELATADPRPKAFAVIGLTSALDAVSEEVEFLGYANEPGRYIILRGYAPGAERAAFERAFHDLDAEERDSVLEARRRHTRTVLLLHELGHNLGAPHATALPDDIMAPTLSLHAAAFAAPTRAMLQAAIDTRLGRESAPPGVRAEPATAKHAQVVLRVTAGGDVLFGGQPVDLDTVAELLRQSAADDPQTEVVLQFAHGAPPAVIAGIADRAKAAKLTRVSVLPAD
jgi:biopolymer transport protein ExbD